jgi:hypothetical protein
LNYRSGRIISQDVTLTRKSKQILLSMDIRRTKDACACMVSRWDVIIWLEPDIELALNRGLKQSEISKLLKITKERIHEIKKVGKNTSHANR